jgi:beta-lactamase regulating signal transducer with metallopeptidase domain
MIGPVVIHLIESTLFAAIAAVLLLVFRVRQPGVRHAAWLLVAVKFALPASIFMSLGTGMRALAPQPIPTAWYGGAALLAHVSTMPVRAHVSNASIAPMETALLFIWLTGAIFAIGVWLRRLDRPLQTVPAPAAEAVILHRLRTQAGIRRDVTLRHSRNLIAPGLTGILTPVICVPKALADELEPAEFESVLLHELAHVRRWDNLCSAAVHAIACVFWFYPPLWWIERKIAFEAERACDDLVVRWGAPRESYADAILKVCRLHIAAPLAGVSGIGSNLSSRMEWILSGRIGQRGGFFSGVAIALLLAAMTVAPVAVGFIARPALALQSAPPVSATVPQNLATAAPDKKPEPEPRASQRRSAKPIATATSTAAQDQKPPEVRCAYMSVWYPEGTVGRMGSDRMCVAAADGSPWWAAVETAGRPQVGEIVDLWAVKNEPEGLPVCTVRESKSTTECSCQSGPVALGEVVTSARGESLVCGKRSTRKVAEWQPASQGKDYQ